MLGFSIHGTSFLTAVWPKNDIRYQCVSRTYPAHPTCEILWKVLCFTDLLGMKGSFRNDYYYSEEADNASQWCHEKKKNMCVMLNLFTTDQEEQYSLILYFCYALNI
jgi:hypothetical protein